MRGNFVCLCNDKFNYNFECKSDTQYDYFRIKKGCKCTYSPEKFRELRKKYTFKNGNYKSNKAYQDFILEMKNN
jgi:hypothetical protein